MIPMRIRGLTCDPATRHAIMVLEDLTGTLGLAFFLPLNEANRLARVLGSASCPHTPVYELVLDLLAHLDAVVAHAVLDGRADGIGASLVLLRDGSEIALPCHPADAIALALRTEAPIYASPEAMAHACTLGQPRGHEAPHPDVAGWLERVKPDDFEG
jgi:hypothetical protein